VGKGKVVLARSVKAKR